MSNRLEDLAGKTVMGIIFSVLTLLQVATVIAMLRNPWSFDHWELALASRIASLLFLLLVVYLTLTRLPPKDSAAGLEPRITAIAGTFALMLLIVLPTGTAGPQLLVFSMVLILAGTVLSIYCLYWLGRSFSIMATARELVTSGPYSIVRHPLYLAEAITAVGVVIANWSVAAVLVGAAQCALQFRRIQNEERVLRQTFAGYDAYAARVPMLMPRFMNWEKLPAER